MLQRHEALRGVPVHVTYTPASKVTTGGSAHSVAAFYSARPRLSCSGGPLPRGLLFRLCLFLGGATTVSCKRFYCKTRRIRTRGACGWFSPQRNTDVLLGGEGLLPGGGKRAR